MLWIALFSLFTYIGLLFWLISRHYIPKFMVPMKPATVADARHKLARSSFTVLHLIHSVLFFLVIIWPPVTLGILLHYNGDFGLLPELKVYSNMVVDLAQIEGLDVTGIRQQVIMAKTQIALEAPTYINYFIFSVTQIIKLIMMLFVVLQLRNILASLCNGDSFSAGNSQRLNWIGKLLVVAYLFGPLWNFFLSASVINMVKFSTQAITMTPAANSNLTGLFVGVGVLILSAVIKEAELLRDEQRHTI